MEVLDLNERQKMSQSKLSKYRVYYEAQSIKEIKMDLKNRTKTK